MLKHGFDGMDHFADHKCSGQFLHLVLRWSIQSAVTMTFRADEGRTNGGIFCSSK